MIQKTLIASAISLTLLSACSDSSTPRNESGDGDGSDTGIVGQQRALKQLENSDAFFAALRDGLVQQSLNANRYNNLDGGSVPTAEGGTIGGGTGDTTGGTNESVGQDSSLGSDAADQNTGQSSNSPEDVTTTNVQEVGVDEQDRMKSDGEFLYILDNQHNNYFPVDEAIDIGIPEPLPNGTEIDTDAQTDSADFIIDLLPINTDVDPVSTSIAYPQQNVTVRLRILALQNDAPDALPVKDLKIDLKGAQADGMYLYKNDNQRSLIMTGSSFNNYYGLWDDSYAFGNANSVIAKLDVTDPNQASIESSFQIDGQIISSRRIDDTLFVASRYYPVIAEIDRYSMTPDEYQRAISTADLTGALPKVTQLSDGKKTELVNPSECFVAARGQSADYYYTPDIVTLAVFDLQTMQLKDSECFLGATETLYATPNSVYLATTRWDYSSYPVLEVTDQVSTTSYVDPRVDTDIHQFTINGTELKYSGSGVVSGHLGWNPDRKPFRMSEKDGYLRVATFSEAQNQSVSPIKLSVLDVTGDGALVKVAELPNQNNPAHIGKPGEQLYASRFLGDKAYLVTFRQTDPLYVVDISNPADPKLAGELEIKGYSDYLQPIGEDYLLGIGKDAVPAPDGRGDGFGALQQGVKLSLFNVADASNPIEVQSLVVGERGTEAEALQNHRAITIQRATDTHPTRVAFGINVAGLADPRPASNDPFTWYPWNFTGLHGFDIKVGDGAGIEKRGVMVVNSASNPSGSGFGYYNNDRSVIVGDSVYYIHGSSVYAAHWSDLGNFTGPR